MSLCYFNTKPARAAVFCSLVYVLAMGFSVPAGAKDPSAKPTPTTPLQPSEEGAGGSGGGGGGFQISAEGGQKFLTIGSRYKFRVDSELSAEEIPGLLLLKNTLNKFSNIFRFEKTESGQSIALAHFFENLHPGSYGRRYYRVSNGEQLSKKVWDQLINAKKELANVLPYYFSEGSVAKENGQEVIYALTHDSTTYLFDPFFGLDSISQQVILFHESQRVPRSYFAKTHKKYKRQYTNQELYYHDIVLEKWLRHEDLLDAQSRGARVAEKIDSDNDGVGVLSKKFRRLAVTLSLLSGDDSIWLNGFLLQDTQNPNSRVRKKTFSASELFGKPFDYDVRGYGAMWRGIYSSESVVGALELVLADVEKSFFLEGLIRCLSKSPTTNIPLISWSNLQNEAIRHLVPMALKGQATGSNNYPVVEESSLTINLSNAPNASVTTIDASNKGNYRKFISIEGQAPYERVYTNSPYNFQFNFPICSPDPLDKELQTIWETREIRDDVFVSDKIFRYNGLSAQAKNIEQNKDGSVTIEDPRVLYGKWRHRISKFSDLPSICNIFGFESFLPQSEESSNDDTNAIVLGPEATFKEITNRGTAVISEISCKGLKK